MQEKSLGLLGAGIDCRIIFPALKVLFLVSTEGAEGTAIEEDERQDGLTLSRRVG